MDAEVDIAEATTFQFLIGTIKRILLSAYQAEIIDFNSS